MPKDIKTKEKKELDTNQDTHCIKIGVQLWWTLQDSNL